MSDVPFVKPVNVKEYDFKQSKYEIAPRLPFSQIIVGPIGSGKGILLQSMILDIYRDVFARIYIWSPSISVDSRWTLVKKYIQDNLKVDLEKEKCMFDEYVPSELEAVIKRQHKVIECQKKNDQNKLYSILIIVDDFADSKKFLAQQSIIKSIICERSPQQYQHNNVNAKV